MLQFFGAQQWKYQATQNSHCLHKKYGSGSGCWGEGLGILLILFFFPPPPFWEFCLSCSQANGRVSAPPSCPSPLNRSAPPPTQVSKLTYIDVEFEVEPQTIRSSQASLGVRDKELTVSLVAGFVPCQVLLGGRNRLS